VTPTDSARAQLDSRLSDLARLRQTARERDPRFPVQTRIWLRQTAALGCRANWPVGSLMQALRVQFEAVEDAAVIDNGGNRPAASRMRALWRERGFELLARAEQGLLDEIERQDRNIQARMDDAENAIRAAGEARMLPAPTPDRARWIEQVWTTLFACPQSRHLALRIAGSLDGAQRRRLLDRVFREVFEI
jgi:hypothetical protein